MSVLLEPAVRATGEPRTASPPSRSLPRALPWVGAYLVGQALFFLFLRQVSPRFFWVDDQQVQYLPAFHWFGRHLVDGRPPLLAPEQGGAGNFVADAQYGAYSPVHWLLSALVARASDLNDAAWLITGGCMVLLGVGVVLLLLHYGCHPVLAVAAPLGLVNTGFLLWWGSSWFTLLLGVGLLPWLWLGLASRSRWAILVTGLAAYLLVSSGYTYSVVFAGLLVLAQMAERWLQAGPRALLAREAVARAAAGAAGVLAGLPTLVGLAQMAPVTNRAVFDAGPLGNSGSYTLSLLDGLLGSSTLTPLVSGYFSGNLLQPPVAATAVFALPAVALVRWRDVWRRPGVLTAGLLLAVAAAATQLPTYVGSLRLPVRYLAETGLFLPVLVALGLTYGMSVTRQRLTVAGLLIAAQAGLALLRAPALVRWHAVALLVTVLAVAGVVGLRQRRRALALAGAAALLATALLGPVLSERSAVSVQARLDIAAGLPVTGQPLRNFPTRPEWGTTVESFREQSALLGRDVTVMGWGSDIVDPDSGWGYGFLAGNANLVSDVQPGFSYGGTGHAGWATRTCQDFLGQHRPFPGCVQRMVEPVPGLDGVAWMDAMATDEVLLPPEAPPEVAAYFAQNWRAAGTVSVYTRYLRTRPTPGRVTGTTGAVEQVEQLPGAGGPAYGGRALDAYSVSTGPQGGELVLRIPFWSGLEATAAGRAVEVTDLDDTLTVVRLPGGLDDAEVRLEFRPLSEDLLWPTLVLGGLGIALATALGRPLRRRRTAAQP